MGFTYAKYQKPCKTFNSRSQSHSSNKHITKINPEAKGLMTKDQNGLALNEWQ